NEFNRDYIARDATNNIKGIFVILILFSHARSYFTLGGIYDEPYISFQGHLNQMVVAMFLFYSGYGIMEQIKKREFSYIMSIPKKRFPNLLLNFDIAVFLFMILWIVLKKPLTLRMILKSLIAWDGIGNSSWYIFVTFCLYIFIFISFFAIKWFNKKPHLFIYLAAVTALTVALVYFLRKTKEGQPWWYNTAILFPLGMWYSFFKEYIEKLIMKNDLIYYSIFAVMITAYIYTYLHRSDKFVIYTAWAILFTLGLTIITMKVKTESNLLKWFGEHIFSIYILQRIPMIILKELGVADRHKYIFVIVSIAVTCAMAEIFDVLTGKLGKAIWKPKKA
ncbi:MAG: acyltransferase family protein, partial [Eubacterium sp.]|nr:acyltransferase family protein [Eubacterium sp.]